MGGAGPELIIFIIHQVIFMSCIIRYGMKKNTLEYPCAVLTVAGSDKGMPVIFFPCFEYSGYSISVCGAYHGKIRPCVLTVFIRTENSYTAHCTVDTDKVRIPFS